MKEIKDYDLIKKYLKGDEASLEILIKRYLDQIYRLVYTYVKDQQIAEDITQDVFLKIWKNVKKVDKNKNFKSWVLTIAKNTALDYIKKKKAIPFSRFEDENQRNVLAERLADNSKLPNQISESLEASRVFSEAIKTLSYKYQQVLTLYYYQYFNFREIAKMLEEPVNTIKSRHRRGLMLLKRSLGDGLS